MKNITLASCSYNTPLVTLTMIKSFFHHHNEKVPVFICDNSTNEDTSELLTKHKIPFLRNVNGLHSPSVDVLINHCNTDYMLLVDTDVIFLKNHNTLLEQLIGMDLTLMGEVCGDRGGKRLHKRVHPWHCFINVKHIKQHNIKFYDSTRLSDPSSEIIYDVGSSFFEDIRKLKLNIGNCKLQDVYYKHYEGMSWRTQKYGLENGNIDIDPNTTHNDLNLYKYGMLVNRAYEKEIEKHKHVLISV